MINTEVLIQQLEVFLRNANLCRAELEPGRESRLLAIAITQAELALFTLQHLQRKS